MTMLPMKAILLPKLLPRHRILGSPAGEKITDTVLNEAGRGFGVVATEIQKLAEQSNTADMLAQNISNFQL